MYGFYELYALFNFLSGLVTLVFWVVVIIIAAYIIKRIFLPDKYGDDSVVQSWGSLLVGQSEIGSKYLASVEQAFRDKGLNYEKNRKTISMSSTSLESDEYLAVRMNSNYTCYFGFVPQGKDLHVTWLLQDHMIKGIYKLPLIGPMLLNLFKRYTFAMTNRVRAFASVTHDCAVEATEKLMDELGLDKTKLNRKTSGKLGPI